MILYINYIADQVYARSADKWQIDNDFLKMEIYVEGVCSHRYNICYGQTYKLYLIWYLNQMILFGLLMKIIYYIIFRLVCHFENIIIIIIS